MTDSEEIINDIVAHVQIEQQNTHREFKKVADNMIFEYIKKYRLIMHGYYALEHLVKNKNIKITEDITLPIESNRYFQCYSMKGSKNVGDLIKNLGSLGYQPVRSQVTHTIYGSAKCRIVIGRDPGLIVTEIITVDKREYNNLQTSIINIDGLLVVNSLILEIEALNGIMNRHNWDTNYSQLSIILNSKLNPFNDKHKRVDIRGRSPQKILGFLMKDKWKNKIVFTGDYVFTSVYLRKYNPEGNLAIITDYISGKEIADQLLKIGNDSWKLFKYSNMVDLIDNIYAIKDGKKILVRIHVTAQSTIPYVMARLGKYKNVKVADYLLLLRYYSSILLSHQIRSSDCYHIKQIINKIISIRHNYLSKRKLVGTEPASSVFRILDTPAIELESEWVIHNKKMWEYKRRYGTEGYNQVKRMCQPLMEDL